MASTKSSITNCKPSKAKWSPSEAPPASRCRGPSPHHLLPLTTTSCLITILPNLTGLVKIISASGIVTLPSTMPPAPITTRNASPAPSSPSSRPSHLPGVLGEIRPLLYHLSQARWNTSRYCSQPSGCSGNGSVRCGAVRRGTGAATAHAGATSKALRQLWPQGQQALEMAEWTSSHSQGEDRAGTTVRPSH